MTEIVNLRQARKQARREAERQAADENAARHGLTKGERRRQEMERARGLAHLDRHRRETED
ncbi:DUF4169 family protein [Amaricoccus solimangrovi]|uniref:DUF4169 family protein n=1 Tax=Amaricoccus solimangrovi TaxID=2589815 RepID=A0A501WKW7_9RHOB|nr:DUF4169 family protein [Amaricoccus solimangrovi]TPE50149.1 DUF4169 family protein [Amaricoccus solimangrovi]